jgi:hypothetical protein
LRGQDDAAIRRLFTSSVRSYFATNRGICVEGDGRVVVFYRDNKMEKIDDLPQFLNQGVEIANLLNR